MEKIWTTLIGAEDLPCTAGEALRRIAGLTAHQVRSAKFRKNGITVNGKPARVTTVLCAGDELSVRLEDSEEDILTKRSIGQSTGISTGQSTGTSTGQSAGKSNGQGSGESAIGSIGRVIPVERELSIIYEDEDLLAVHKDAGVAVHPSHGHYYDTLANAVAWHLQSDTQVRTVGRLDADTSGIVIFARNKVACERLSRSGAVKKTYIAIAFGQTEAQFDLTFPMRKIPGELNKMECLREVTSEVTSEATRDALADPADAEVSSREGWMRAVTHARKIAEGSDYSVLQVHIETGRTHQIRAHMAASGHPLLGDPIYGAWEDEAYVRGSGTVARAALHCGRIELKQPFTGEEIVITDPLPEDMRRIYGEELIYEK